MKHAGEVQDLMRAFPGREFRMVQIVRYIANGRRMDRRQHHALKIAVWRVLRAFAEAGVIDVRPPTYQRGGPAFYAWKVSHAVGGNGAEGDSRAAQEVAHYWAG